MREPLDRQRQSIVSPTPLVTRNCLFPIILQIKLALRGLSFAPFRKHSVCFASDHARVSSTRPYRLSSNAQRTGKMERADEVLIYGSTTRSHCPERRRVTDLPARSGSCDASIQPARALLTRCVCQYPKTQQTRRNEVIGETDQFSQKRPVISVFRPPFVLVDFRTPLLPGGSTAFM
jgi:hypothetical protein